MIWKFLWSWVSWGNLKEEVGRGVFCVVGKVLMCVMFGRVRGFLWGEGV